LFNVSGLYPGILSGFNPGSILSVFIRIESAFIRGIKS